MDLFNWCDRPEAVHGYVNIYEQYLYLSGIDRGLHSSFVVFYFVFVLYGTTMWVVVPFLVWRDRYFDWFSYSVPVKQNASVPQSISGRVDSGAKSPKTEEPEPLMDA